jgi:hypothetical protein
MYNFLQLFADPKVCDYLVQTIPEDDRRHARIQRIENNYNFLASSYDLLQQMNAKLKEWGLNENLVPLSGGGFSLVFGCHFTGKEKYAPSLVVKVINTSNQNIFCEQHYNPEVIRNCPVVVEPIHTHSFQNQWNRGYYIEVMPYLSPLEKDKEEDRKAFERVRKTLRRYQIEDNDLSIDCRRSGKCPSK